MNLQPGQNILHYRIVEKIGEGGMGEIWKAVDTTLGREIAIKFITEQFAGDAERLDRFVREAKMLATLNHPNIAAVYGLHQWDGGSSSAAPARPVHFIAMELVPGEDLQQRLARGPLAVEDAVDVARQVADALEAAHEQGVIHRDLKPANIKRTPAGKIKVLDLGLAKALSPENSADPVSASLSPTVTSAGTVAGTLLGTAGYMSPEQAKGRPVDSRADIWAFGVVLHEMLTGKKLFQAETISETLAAVLRDEVPMHALPESTPEPVKALLGRCLDRDPRTRLRDIGEARIALSTGTSPAGAFAAAPASGAREAPSGLSRVVPWLLVFLLSVASATLLWRAAGPAPESQVLTLMAPFPDELRLPSYQMGSIALSPDGTALALVLNGAGIDRLYIRRLDRGTLTPMPGTENSSSPFFSPDGQWVGFFAEGKLKKVPVAGGAPVTLAESVGANRGADWGTDDVIVFSPHFSQPLMRVSGAGGTPTPFTTIDIENGDRTHRWPQAVPGKDLVLFTVGTVDSPENYDDARIHAIRPSTGEQVQVLEGASMARYVPSGHLVFGREGFLFAVPFDVDSLEVLGSPVPVLEDVMGMRNSGAVHAAFANNGLLAYIVGVPRSRESRLVVRGRDGSSEVIPVPVGGYINPRLSPDGKQIALVVDGSQTVQISTYNLEQQTLTRLTFDGDNDFPVWSPDGRRIAFGSVRDNALQSIYVKAADGSGLAELYFAADRLENSGSALPAGWTPDGRSMILEVADDNLNNIAVFSEEDGETRMLVATPGTEMAAALSPNGRWLAYASDETGEMRIFVRTFPEPGGKWQISSNGAVNPRWSPDGKTLFYRALTSLYAVGVDDSNGFRASHPEIVFDDLITVEGSYYDYAPLDANRFIVIEDVTGGPSPGGVTVVVNWLDELARRVPR